MKNGYLIIILSAALLLLTNGCGNKTTQDGPDAVVEGFCKALAEGDWDKAACLCDSVAMKDYLQCYQEAWERFSQEDSDVLEIASSVLAGAEIEIKKVEKAEEGRAVHYTIEIEGQKKDRKAIVKKNEEGEWRVTTITEAA